MFPYNSLQKKKERKRKNTKPLQSRTSCAEYDSQISSELPQPLCSSFNLATYQKP